MLMKIMFLDFRKAVKSKDARSSRLHAGQKQKRIGYQEYNRLLLGYHGAWEVEVAVVGPR